MNEREIFVAALQVEDGSEREAYLDQACGDDEPLRERVGALLAAFDQASDFMQSPGEFGATHEPNSGQFSEAKLAATLATPQRMEGTGAIIGPYKLLQELGEGGMGTVFMAEQTEPVRRQVALKIIKPGMDSRQVIARFEAERQALALMDHQNIARVFDAGTTDSGRPYFVMELIKGVPITRYCDEKQLSPHKRLELMVPVCQALQHAHQKGIIHRDIKPSNVLVTLYDGRPVPKVIDFGIAKATGHQLTDKTVFTEVGQIVGTLEYMSPEQAELNQLDVDTRSDVYSLGVLLYELLTGSTPISRERLREVGLGEMLRTIREEEPPKPSTRLSDSGEALPSISAVRGTEPARLSKLVRGELDWIVMRALDKDRSRRYESAGNLAGDLERFLAGDAVTACPPSAAYRLRKFARRHKVMLTTSALVALSLILGTIVSVTQAIRASRAETVATNRAASEEKARREAVSARAAEEEQRKLAQRRTYAANSLLIQTTWEQMNFTRFAELIDAQKPASEEEDLRGFEWYFWKNAASRGYQSLAGHVAGISGVSLSAEAPLAAVAASGGRGPGEIWLWDLVNHKGRVVSRHDDRIRDVALSPDGDRLAFGTGRTEKEGSVVLRDLRTGRERVLRKFPHAVNSVKFSADGKRLAAASLSLSKLFGLKLEQPCEVIVWDLTAQEPRVIFSESDKASLYFSVDFDAPSERIAVTRASATGNAVEIWDISEQAGKDRKPQTIEGKVGSILWDAAFSPAGQQIAIAAGPWSNAGMVEIWDLKTLKELPIQLRGHQGRVVDVSYDKSGERIATASFDRTVRIWNAEKGRLIHTLRGHRESASAATFTPDGFQLVSGADDRTVRLWNASEGQQATTLRIDKHSVGAVAFNPDGSRFAAGGSSGVVAIWDTQTVQRTASLKDESPHHVTAIAFSSDDRYLAVGTGSEDPTQPKWGAVLVWDLERQEVVKRLSGHSTQVLSVAFSPDGRQLVSVSGHYWSGPGEVKLWDVESGKEEPLPPESTAGYLGTAVFSSDGKYIAWGGARALPIKDRQGKELIEGVITVWDRETKKEAFSLSAHDAPVLCVSLSRDGKRLAAGSADHTISIWNMDTRQQSGVLRGHKGRVHCVDFNPDGQRLVSSGQDKNVKLWDLSTVQELLTLTEHPGYTYSLDFSPEGQHIVSGCSDGVVKLWDGSSSK